jgi:hypothetical protein
MSDIRVTSNSPAKSVSVTSLHNERNVPFVTGCCPTCGHPVALDDIAQALSPLPRQIYEAVRGAGQAGIHERRLETVIYGHLPRGAPLTNSIKVMVCRAINPLLKPQGVRIRSRCRVYRIEKLP